MFTIFRAEQGVVASMLLEHALFSDLVLLLNTDLVLLLNTTECTSRGHNHPCAMDALGQSNFRVWKYWPCLGKE
jgi:hypothetical protein